MLTAFFSVWLGASVFGVIVRGHPIYKEPDPHYRKALVIVGLPAILLGAVVSTIYGFGVALWVNIRALFLNIEGAWNGELPKEPI